MQDIAAGSSDTTLVFSYGSNSTAQLRARVQNQSLSSRPARILGFSRVFCLHSTRWGGAVASLSPDPSGGAVVYGAIVELNVAEVALLDAFEGNYRKVIFDVMIGPEDGSAWGAKAMAYIAGREVPTPDNGHPWTPPMDSLPSPAYLVAIHGMLREHWPSHALDIAIRGHDASTGAAGPIVSQWVHPGPAALPLEVPPNFRCGLRRASIAFLFVRRRSASRSPFGGKIRGRCLRRSRR